jgi:hypothetical protein
MMEAAKLRAALPSFTGTTTWTRYSPALFRQLLLTDGVKFLADNAGAYWLCDAIGSHIFTNPRLSPQLEYFQVWTFRRAAINELDKPHRLWVTNGNDKKAIVEQLIDYSSFPLPEIVLWAVWDEGMDAFVLMLPSEY